MSGTLRVVGRANDSKALNFWAGKERTTYSERRTTCRTLIRLRTMGWRRQNFFAHHEFCNEILPLCEAELKSGMWWISAEAPTLHDRESSRTVLPMCAPWICQKKFDKSRVHRMDLWNFHDLFSPKN